MLLRDFNENPLILEFDFCVLAIAYPSVDSGPRNLAVLLQRLVGSDDSFLDSEIADKWYKDGDMHTMYVGQIIDVLAR